MRIAYHTCFPPPRLEKYKVNWVHKSERLRRVPASYGRGTATRPITIPPKIFKISCVELHSGSNLYTKAFQYRQLPNPVE